MRRKLALFAAISMAVGLAACTKIESRDLIREGNQLYSDAKFEEAIEKYNRSLELEPDGVTVLWNRAMAAESIVLRLKDSTNEKDIAARKEYATLALESLEQWNEKRDRVGEQDRLPECARPKPEGEDDEDKDEDKDKEESEDPDLDAYEQHRLAILGADSRCDDLIEHWRQMHMACPQNEDLYMTIAQTFEDICGMPEKTEEWYIKRTEDFPDSAKAWYSLATRRFYPLMPDPEAGLAFNPAIPAEDRIALADEVIGYLERASELDPKYRDPFVWRSMAYTQKSLAREYVDPPETPQDAVEAILKRRDIMLAWREQKAVCDLEKIPECALTLDIASPAPAINPGVVFRDLESDGASWKDEEVSLFGNVVNDSVKQSDKDGYVWEFDLEVPYVPEAPVPVEGEEPPAEAPAAEQTTKIVKVVLTFPRDEVAEGEEPIDRSGEINAQMEAWKSIKSVPFTGTIEGKGGEFMLTAVHKPNEGCCPIAPLTPEEEKSDADRLEQLRAEIAAAEQAEKEAASKYKGKGRKGR